MRKIIFFSLIILLMLGCSKPTMTLMTKDGKELSIDDKQLILGDGFSKLPMPFYDLSMKSQDYLRCHKKGFCVLPPLFKERDFKLMNNPWNMMVDSNGFSIYTGQTRKNGGIILDYSVSFSAINFEYGERAREIEAGNVEYMKNWFTSLKPTAILTIENHGKENYSCVVIETSDIKWGKNKSYRCEKYNLEKTKVISVLVYISYTRSPTLPKELEQLAQEYTYEDLLQRTQRVLDSLYIKDGWDD
jgi:hypothetical protein